jgi:hypothetical protein
MRPPEKPDGTILINWLQRNVAEAPEQALQRVEAEAEVVGLVAREADKVQQQQPEEPPLEPLQQEAAEAVARVEAEAEVVVPRQHPQLRKICSARSRTY